MIMHIDYIQKILKENTDTSDAFKRNLVKDYLQILVLSYLYSHKDYRDLIFYGGSALRHCYELERLSEDLDFVDTKNIDLEKLSKDMVLFFKKELDRDIISKCQKFRAYLKIPILHGLGLAHTSESNLLYLKIEIFNEFKFKDFETKIIPIFKFNKSLLVKTFDLPTLMATKINAVLYRKWEKTSKAGKTLCTVKGRDYYDLVWYLHKKIIPNIKCISGITSYKDLKIKLLETVKNVDTKSIELDLLAFIKDTTFVKNLSKNITSIISEQIQEVL